MQTVYKYRLDRDCDIHAGAKFVNVGKDLEGVPCVWAIVDTTNNLVRYKFHCIWTGRPLRGGDYIGTVTNDGLIWHIFAEEVQP
jgi:hypothetical protein